MRTHSRPAALLVAFLAALCIRPATAQTCFYPDGSEVNDLSVEVCGGSNTTFSSTCCDTGRGDQCRRNGLCTYQDNYDYRGGCSSENWDECQEICPGINNGTWTQVRECATNEYCCVLHEDRDCCTNNAERFSLSAPEVESPSPSPSGGGGGGGSPPPSNEDDGLSTGAIGGIAGAVGGAALAGIAFGVWWFIRRRKKQQAAAAGAAGPGMSPSSQAATLTLNGTPLPEDKNYGGGDFPAGAELPGSGNVPEMEATEAPVEADSRQVIAESDSRPVQQPRVFHEMAA